MHIFVIKIVSRETERKPSQRKTYLAASISAKAWLTTVLAMPGQARSCQWEISLKLKSSATPAHGEADNTTHRVEIWPTSLTKCAERVPEN